MSDCCRTAAPYLYILHRTWTRPIVGILLIDFTYSVFVFI
jgi:hypothetical protein